MNKKIVIGIIFVLIALVALFYLGDGEKVNYTTDQAEKIAQNWILENSPTYLERGGDNLIHATTDSLNDHLYEVIFDFEADFAGYGSVDDEEMNAQFITPHTTVVRVDKNKVTSVVTDEIFDEMTGQMLNEENIDSSGNAEEETMTLSADLYFVQVVDQTEEVVPVSREIEISTSEEEAVLNALLRGVTSTEEEQGYSSAIPEDTELISCSVEDGVATVDFSSAIEPGGGSAWVTAIKEQITKTLTQFDFIEDVVILVEGEEGLQP